MNNTRRSVVICLLLAEGVVAEPLTLEACIDLALAHNDRVLSAELGVVRAGADASSARARRLPSLNANLFGFTRSRTGPSLRIQENPTGEVDPVTGQRVFRSETTRIPATDRNSYALSTSLSQTLFDGGELRHAHGAARQVLATAELDLAGSRADVVLQVKQRYYGLLKAQELVEVQREAFGLSQRRLEEAQARLEVGAGTRVDVLRLQVAADNAQADFINAEQQVLLARATLNHAMGRTLSEPLEVEALGDRAPTGRFLSADLDDSSATRPPVAELVQKAGRANPDVARLRSAERAAALSLSSAQAAWYPRLSGSASYSRNNEVFDRVFGDPGQNYRFNAGVSLTYNVFDGGLRSAGVTRGRVAVETARLNLEQEQRDLALAVETTYLEMVRLAKILQIAERTAQLAAEDLHLAEERYNVGKGTLLEVLDAQVGLTQARSSRVRTRYDLATAEANLARLVD